MHARLVGVIKSIQHTYHLWFCLISGRRLSLPLLFLYIYIVFASTRCMANFGPGQLGDTHSMYTLVLVNFWSFHAIFYIYFCGMATLHVIWWISSGAKSRCRTAAGLLECMGDPDPCYSEPHAAPHPALILGIPHASRPQPQMAPSLAGLPAGRQHHNVCPQQPLTQQFPASASARCHSWCYTELAWTTSQPTPSRITSCGSAIFWLLSFKSWEPDKSSTSISLVVGSCFH